MGRAFTEADGFMIPFDEESAGKMTLICLKNPGQALFVSERDGRLNGMILGVLSPWLWNENVRLATELLWWVDPGARGSRVGIALLDAMTEWAEANEADFISFASIEAIAGDRVSRIYERLGYVLTEKTFTRRLKCQERRV